jgi:hypothetical protein
VIPHGRIHAYIHSNGPALSRCPAAADPDERTAGPITPDSTTALDDDTGLALSAAIEDVRYLGRLNAGTTPVPGLDPDQKRARIWQRSLGCVDVPSEVEGHVFISYVREDSRRVDRLQQVLQSAGIRVWRDTANLWPGED